VTCRLPTDYSTAYRLGADRRISICGIKGCDGRRLTDLESVSRREDATAGQPIDWP